jgi:hypothetical protein
MSLEGLPHDEDDEDDVVRPMHSSSRRAARAG